VAAPTTGGGKLRVFYIAIPRGGGRTMLAWFVSQTNAVDVPSPQGEQWFSLGCSCCSLCFTIPLPPAHLKDHPFSNLKVHFLVLARAAVARQSAFVICNLRFEIVCLLFQNPEYTPEVNLYLGEDLRSLQYPILTCFLVD
jgi:hypothetical protein